MPTLRETPDASRVASGFTMAGRTSSWLTPRQLIVVEQHLVMEEYRRFDLGNLQAVVLYRTRTGMLGSALLTLGILLFGTLAVVAARSGEAVSVILVPGGAALLLAISLGMHWMSGPTARLELHTGVQRYTVPGIHRWRAGLRMLDAVTRAAHAVQGPPAAPAASGPESPRP